MTSESVRGIMYPSVGYTADIHSASRKMGRRALAVRLRTVEDRTRNSRTGEEHIDDFASFRCRYDRR